MAPLELILRLFVSVLVIAGGVFALTWFTKRSRGGPNGFFSVHARLPVAKGVTLAVVQAGSRFFLLGLSEKGTELISELEEGDALPRSTEEKSSTPPFGSAGTAFGPMFAALKGRGVLRHHAMAAAHQTTMTDLPEGMLMDPAALNALTSITETETERPRKGFLARLQHMTLRSYVGRPFHARSN